MKAAAELGLGTVQWGLPYGVANARGQTPRDEVSAILAEARRHGVRVLDTASQYGEAESVLGQNALDGFRIITKTPSFGTAEISAGQAGELSDSFRRSLARLSCERVYGLLLHRVDDLLAPGGDRLLHAMEALKAQGLVSKIGVSIYEGRQINAVLRLFRPDIVQLPLNVFDQRLLRSGYIDRLKAAGVEVHVRSVFLQGLLLMPLDRLPVFFTPIRDLLSRWHEAVAGEGLSPTQAALAFVRDCPGVDVMLAGVDTVGQFRTCLADYAGAPAFDASGLGCDDARYVNPMNWKVN
jgi:aryl-alcohol dehydrogenase-like predicted oxidoreductase